MERGVKRARAPEVIALVATNGSRTTGGLSSYLRGLGASLRSQSVRVDEVIRFPTTAHPSTDYADVPDSLEQAGPNEELFGPGLLLRPIAKLLPKAVGRPVTQPLARAVHVASVGASLRQALADDVEHVHWIGTGWELTGFAVLREARRRKIGFSIWPAIHPGGWGDSPFDGLLYREADAVFAQSVAERNVLIALGVRESAVCICGLAPSVRGDGLGARCRAVHGLGDHPVVAFVGRNDAYKGFDTLVEAMAEVWSSVPDARVLRCGPRGSVRSVPVTDPRIIDLGLVSEQEKSDLLAAADVFCLPSRHEAFGLAFVEAWMYATPVVAGRTPAIEELVTDGKDGFVVEPQSGPVAAALLRLLGDPQMRQRMGEAGQRKQREHFTWERVAAAHRAAFTR